MKFTWEGKSYIEQTVEIEEREGEIPQHTTWARETKNTLKTLKDT